MYTYIYIYIIMHIHMYTLCDCAVTFPLTYFYLPKSARVYLFPQPVKIP